MGYRQISVLTQGEQSNPPYKTNTENTVHGRTCFGMVGRKTNGSRNECCCV